MSFIFWKNWKVADQIAAAMGTLAVMALAAYLLYVWNLGDANILHWVWSPELDVLKFGYRSITEESFQLNQEGKSFLITGKMLPSFVAVEPYVYTLYFWMQMLATVWMLSALPGLRRFPFFIGLILMALLITQMDLVGLGVFMESITDPRYLLDHPRRPYFFLFIAYGVLLLPAYVFQQFVKVPFLLRLLVNGLMAALLIWLGSSSPMPDPMRHIVVHSYAVPMLMAAALVLLTAHEPVRAMVWLTSATGMINSARPERRFLLLVAVYVLYLVYGVLYLADNFYLDFPPPDPFVLLVITAVFSVWGMAQRRPHWEALADDAHSIPLLHIGAVLLVLATAAFAWGTGNQAMVKAIGQYALYCHAGMGVAFGFYVIQNFRKLYADHQPVYKVLFKPLDMDFGTTQGIGVFLIGAILFAVQFGPFRRAVAGYQLNHAERAREAGNFNQAIDYLLNGAVQYHPVNFREHFTLGELYMRQNKLAEAEAFFEKVHYRDPSPFANAWIAEIKSKQNNFIYAITELERGLRKFPQSGELYNNLALSYNQTSLADSVLANFMKAKRFAEDRAVIRANMFALWTKYDFDEKMVDNVVMETAREAYTATIRANELAFLNQSGRTTTDDFELALLDGDALTTDQLAYIHNYVLNKKGLIGKPLIDRIHQLIAVEDNYQFEHFLRFDLALAYYSQYLPIEAFAQLDQAIQLSPGVPEYYSYRGLWNMEHQRYAQAAADLKSLWMSGIMEARLQEAIALSQLKDKTKALSRWQQIAQTAQNPQERQISADMLRILSPDSLSREVLLSADLPDQTRYRYVYYHRSQTDTTWMQSLIEAMQDARYGKAAAHLALMEAIAREDADAARTFYAYFSRGAGLNDPELSFFYQEAILAYAAFTGQFPEIYPEILGKAKWPFPKSGQLAYYLGAFQSASGEKAQALDNFSKATEQAPFFAPGWLAKAEIHRLAGQGSKAYETLRQSVIHNPNSVVLRKAYAIESNRQGYLAFARPIVEELESEMTQAEFERFLKEFEAAGSEMQWE